MLILGLVGGIVDLSANGVVVSLDREMVAPRAIHIGR